MSETCPLKSLTAGDLAINVYIVGYTILQRAKFRLNCRHCTSGYVDFVASKAAAIPDDTTRFETTIEQVLSINSCGFDGQKDDP